ncbi:MAG: GtrA family protein [Lachnospiraceae bacterium]|nr:GtrA family protein [Lachnospiraceae bacterium]
MKKEKKEKNKKALLKQILKFGVVGGLSFVIDFVIYSAMVYVFNISIFWSAFWGFTISLIFNYVASMAFVFERKDDASRTKEFIVFTVLSLIGLALNEVIIMGSVYISDTFVVGKTNGFANMVNGLNVWIDGVVAWFMGLIGKKWETIDWIPIEAKIIATAVVMVYNFVTRKIFIEKKD